MGLLSSGSTFLAAARDNEAHDITYRFTSDSTEVAMRASVGFSLYESDQMQLGMIVKRTVDFIVQRSEFVISGVYREPTKGDRIISDHTGCTRTYEVIPEIGDSHVTPHNPRQDSLRIHTKEIG